MNKPRVKLQEVRASKPQSKVDIARQRHGKPFAHEPGSTWKAHETPVLTQFLQSRRKQ